MTRMICLISFMTLTENYLQIINCQSGNETAIQVENLQPATYFLKLIQGNQKLKIFKIIKN